MWSVDETIAPKGFHKLPGCMQTIIYRDFFAITLAKKSLFYYNDVYKVQAVYKRKACTSF